MKHREIDHELRQKNIERLEKATDRKLEMGRMILERISEVMIELDMTMDEAFDFLFSGASAQTLREMREYVLYATTILTSEWPNRS